MIIGGEVRYKHATPGTICAMEMMYDNHIALTTSRDEENHWRVPRLHRVIGYACALADQAGNKGLLKKVGELNDHKGTLTVRWVSDPTQEEMDYFVKAWESIIGDGCDNVEHEHF